MFGKSEQTGASSKNKMHMNVVTHFCHYLTLTKYLLLLFRFLAARICLNFFHQLDLISYVLISSSLQVANGPSQQSRGHIYFPEKISWVLGMRRCYIKTSLRLKVGLQLPKIRLSGACGFQSPPDQTYSTWYSIAHSPGALITCHISVQINHQPDATTGPTTNTARLSPRYEGKTRGCHCSHWAPDNGREKARNMLSCKQTSG